LEKNSCDQNRRFGQKSYLKEYLKVFLSLFEIFLKNRNFGQNLQKKGFSQGYGKQFPTLAQVSWICVHIVSVQETGSGDIQETAINISNVTMGEGGPDHVHLGLCLIIRVANVTGHTMFQNANDS